MLLIVALCLWYGYMNALHPTVPFMDTLRFLTYFDAAEAGQRQLWRTWNQGEHRGLLPQFFVYLNAKVFALNVFGAALTAGVFLAASYLLIIVNQIRGLERKDFESRRLCGGFLFVAFVTLVGLFSFSGWELFSLDVGGALYLKNLIFVAFWVGISKIVESSASKLIVWLLFLAAPIIILLVAFGWSFPFVAATIAAMFPCFFNSSYRKKKILILIAAVLMASLLIYVLGGRFLSVGMSNFGSTGQSWSIANIICGFFFSLASAFVGLDVAQKYPVFLLLQFSGVIGLLGCAGCVFYLLIIKRIKVKYFYLPLSLLAYGGFHLISVAIARGRFDPINAMAPRYFPEVAMVPVGLAWLYFLFRNLPLVGSPVGYMMNQNRLRFFFFLMTASFIFGQLAASVFQFKLAPARNGVFEAMRNATLSAVHGGRNVEILQSPIDTAVAGAMIQQKYAIGVFRNMPCQYKVPGGVWVEKSFKVDIKNCGAPLSVVLYLPENFPAKTVRFSIAGGPVLRRNLNSGMVSKIDLDGEIFEKLISLSIQFDELTVPSEIDSSSSDNRALGALLLSASTDSQLEKK